MLESIKNAFADGFSVQAVIDVLAIVLDAIFGYIKNTEGWVEEDTAA